MSFSPLEVDLDVEQTYFWCSCGLTSKSPFCDGTHKGTGKRSVPFHPEKSGKVFLCQCKQTKTPPYCDGSHKD